jgi:hypothetical protein
MRETQSKQLGVLMLKWILLPFLSAFFCLKAFADPNIKEGDWELSGSSAFTNNGQGATPFGRQSNNYFSVYGSGQYFVKDHFSVGLGGSYLAGPGSDLITLGPIFTKYFLVQENIAPYVSVSPISWSNYGYSASSQFSSSVRLGTKFFLNDHISFGPALEHVHVWSRNGQPSFNTTSFLGVFSLHF